MIKFFKDQRRFFLIMSAMWMLYGLLSIRRYQQNGDEFLWWSGILILIAHSVVFIGFLFKKDRKIES